MYGLRLVIFLLNLYCFGLHPVLAQYADDKMPLTYEEVFDDPYSINKLFFGFQPLYGELFATNVNAGFGIEAQYFHKSSFDVKAHFRTAYSSKFFDFNRELALRNSVQSIKPENFNYIEVGGTYHLKDFVIESTTKILLYKKKFSANRWASAVPMHAEVASKLRKIIGLRTGVFVWKTTVDLRRTLTLQGLINTDLVNLESLSLPNTYMDVNGDFQDLNVYSNLYSTNIYLGTSLTKIRNMEVSFNNYDNSTDDNILTLFMDILFSPSLRLDPVIYNNSEYSTGAINLNNIGMRVGMEGKFNREMGWSYGGEVGYRPSIDGQGIFVLIKIACPVLGSRLEGKVDAFESIK